MLATRPAPPHTRRRPTWMPGVRLKPDPGHEWLSRVNAVAVLLLAVDVGALAAALAAVPTTPPAGWAVAVSVTVLGARACARLYRRRLWLSWLHDLPRSAGATLVAFALLTGIALVAGLDEQTTRSVQWTVVAAAALSEPVRLAVFAFGRWCRRRLGRCDRTIVVGAGKVGADLAATMARHPEYGLAPVGFVDAEPSPDHADLPVELLAEDLSEAIARLRVGTVVLAFSHALESPVVDAAITAHRLGCTVLVVPRMYELYQDGPDIERVCSYPLIRLSTAPTTRPSWWVKRALDVLAAASALVVLAPLIGLCALAVLVESGRPVIFRQVRVGMDDRTFQLYKLRSVRQGEVDDSQSTWSVDGDARVGPVGRFLRRTSIDELPQLWNILRGDMSVVGPRPERPGFVRQFSSIHELYWARHRVPTGLTGLAQVHGLRGDTSIAERSRYDNYYIANWSLWLDLKIVVMTVGELLFRWGR
ncbi:UDP-phosphate galactose phosphotransferase [Actinophytocola xinjiangensis]|uniref:UDP-phosphate galactose phosphotransferase n=1 Tax=Actinophytocola xinjiangensis TaxID=485602 RepID=A0A7Z1AZ17_9PSEU|nr:UDP-phosphate galactose phosphotransferase [Actinophytocola xinjiangensis]